jgi:hypothetical protein
MTHYTIFWKHPTHGEGSYGIERVSVEVAGNEALDDVPENLAGDEDGWMDPLEVSTIQDDIEIVVYEGSHCVRPDRAPDYEVQ